MEVLMTLRLAMWLTAAAVAIVAVGLGIVLGYHWLKYSGDPFVAKLSISTYSGVTLMLLLWLFGSIPV